jgi:predicted ATPase/DNA-binding CsgD family transcriptional regulator/DNA-binding XRE family transcriptional regulator
MATTGGPAQFARLLQQYRAAAGLSQEELADRAGLSRRGISDLERGERRSPHPATVRRLAAGLGLDAVERAALLASIRPAMADGALEEPALLPLPVPPTSFIGRARELAEVGRLLGCTRLLTLTGAGGSGKTRLALEAACANPDAYPDGTALVLLASVADAELVAPTLARALGVRETAGRPLGESLVAYLRPRRLLLLLDNFEHLLEAAPLVGELLGACPRLAILATSREALRLREEQEFAVPPLELPPTARDAPAAALLECASVQLFVQRAAQLVPNFTVPLESARTVADICLRLDGLPLAIELAAARAKVLSPALLLERLEHRLLLLVGGARDLPARQRTLRDTIAWSHDLLMESDRRLFRCLAVFAGGCTLAAAEALCEAEADPGRPVLDGLASLVDKNLVQREDGPDSEPRFVMLETVREFALEQLAQSGEGEAAAERHAEYFLALAERGELAVWMAGPAQLEWLERFERDHDNMRAALRWAEEHGAVELEQRLAGALANFWMIRGHGREGLGRLSTALAHGNAVPGCVRAKALLYAAYMAVLQGDTLMAQRLLDEAVPLAHGSADVSLLSLMFVTRGFLARATGHFAEAVEQFEQAMVLVQGASMAPPGIMRWQHATSLLWLGDLERSNRLHEETLADALAGGDKYVAAAVLCDLGTIALLRGDLQRAAVRLREALVFGGQLGDVLIPEFCLEALAATAGAQGRPRQVAILLGAAERLCVRSGIPGPGVAGSGRLLRTEMTVPHLTSAARAALGAAAFTAAREAGFVLPLEEAIAMALAADEPQVVGTDRARDLPEGLTPREAGVLCMIATGSSNREIANELALSVRTVERHITNLYAKIDARGKADATAYAFRHGLVAE